MAYQALYRTYRPQTFEEVVGQKYIVTTLRNAVTQNKIAHAYLFCGPRGSGKTTIARLLAKAVNCENTEHPVCNECESCKMIMEGTHPDIVEIDGASYGRVETARDLIEKVKYAPLQGKYKVYIIDEVHMLTDNAFNALLKTLEEPPAHAIFVLATTDPQKVLPTIISRCQRFDFTRIDPKDIFERLKRILEKEQIAYEEEALSVISKLAEGGLRDALSILDQVIAYSPEKVSVSDVYDVYGITTPTQKYELIDSIIEKDSQKLLNLVNKLFDGGMDIRRLTTDLIEILKECVVYYYTKDEQLIKNIEIDNVNAILKRVGVERLLEMVDVLMQTNADYHLVSNVNSIFEVATLKMMSLGEVKETKTEKTTEKEIAVTKKKEKTAKTEETSENNEPEIEQKVFDREFLLKLLVKADKQKRIDFNNKWSRIGDYRLDDKFAKAANNLISAKLIAAGQEYALVSVPSLTEADILNDSKFAKELTNLMSKVFNEKTKIYAIDSKENEELVKEFLNRQANNTLPMVEDEKKEEKTEKKDPLEDTMTNLFGEDSFEVIE